MSWPGGIGAGGGRGVRVPGAAGDRGGGCGLDQELRPPTVAGSAGDGAAGRAVGADAVPGRKAWTRMSWRPPDRGAGGRGAGPQVTAAAAAKRQKELGKKEKKRKPKPPAAGASARSGRTAGPAAPAAPWLDPAVTGDPGTSRPGTRWPWTARSARAPRPAGTTRCTCSPPSPYPGIVIAQDKVAKSARRTRSATSGRCWPAAAGRDRGYQRRDAGEPGQRLFLRKVKKAHYLWPAWATSRPERDAHRAAWEDTRSPPPPARSPGPDRDRTSASALRGHRLRGRGAGLLIERYVTYKKKGRWHTGPRPSSTSPASQKTRPRGKLLATSAATGALSTRTGYAT